jgi:glutathione S-transferase
LALLETNAAHELKLTDLKQKPSWFTTLYKSSLGADPASDGKVPILEDGALTLCESGIIADYVLAKSAQSGGPDLLPATPEERALTALFVEQVVGRYVGAFYPLLRAKTPEEQAVAAPKFEAAVEAVDAALQRKGGPYLLGSRCTFGDLMLWPFVSRSWVLALTRGLGPPHTLPLTLKYHFLPLCNDTDRAPLRPDALPRHSARCEARGAAQLDRINGRSKEHTRQQAGRGFFHRRLCELRIVSKGPLHRAPARNTRRERAKSWGDFSTFECKSKER